MASKGSDFVSSTQVRKLKRTFKIIVVGDSNVGKTCLTYRFCEGKFPSRTEATIGVDFRERSVLIGSEEIKLQLWDTAGQERFRRSMLPHYYRNVHAVVFVYDVTKPASFHSLLAWLQECDEHYLTCDIPRLLVGNKCDEPAMISTQVAQRFADGHSMPVFETSAKDDSKADHVESIFLTLAHKLASSRPLMSRGYSSDADTALTKGADNVGGRAFSLRNTRRRSQAADAGDYDEDPCLC